MIERPTDCHICERPLEDDEMVIPLATFKAKNLHAGAERDEYTYIHRDCLIKI